MQAPLELIQHKLKPQFTVELIAKLSSMDIEIKAPLNKYALVMAKRKVFMNKQRGLHYGSAS